MVAVVKTSSTGLIGYLRLKLALVSFKLALLSFKSADLNLKLALLGSGPIGDDDLWSTT